MLLGTVLEVKKGNSKRLEGPRLRNLNERKETQRSNREGGCLSGSKRRMLKLVRAGVCGNQGGARDGRPRIHHLPASW